LPLRENWKGETMLKPLATEVWLDSKKCGAVVSADIKQEQDLKKNPITGEVKPGKLWTVATLVIDSMNVGQWEEKTIIDAQAARSQITLAHTRSNSVLIARNLHVVDYHLSDTGSGPSIVVELAYGEPLEIIPRDEFLKSTSKAA
jgi:hypothetical protein